MSKRIQIEAVANGYIASEAPPLDRGMMCSDPHVFESFDNLVKWLGHQLQKPATEKGQAAQT